MRRVTRRRDGRRTGTDAVGARFALGRLSQRQDGRNPADRLVHVVHGGHRIAQRRVGTHDGNGDLPFADPTRSARTPPSPRAANEPANRPTSCPCAPESTGNAPPVTITPSCPGVRARSVYEMNPPSRSDCSEVSTSVAGIEPRPDRSAAVGLVVAETTTRISQLRAQVASGRNGLVDDGPQLRPPGRAAASR